MCICRLIVTGVLSEGASHGFWCLGNWHQLYFTGKGWRMSLDKEFTRGLKVCCISVLNGYDITIWKKLRKLKKLIGSVMICESHEAGMPNFGYTVDQALHLVWIQSRLYNNEKYLIFVFSKGMSYCYQKTMPASYVYIVCCWQLKSISPSHECFVFVWGSNLSRKKFKKFLALKYKVLWSAL